MPGRHARVAGERLNLQRLGVLPVDPVAHAAQPREIAQVLLRGGSTGHLRDRAQVTPASRSAAGVPCPLAARAAAQPVDDRLEPLGALAVVEHHVQGWPTLAAQGTRTSKSRPRISSRPSM